MLIHYKALSLCTAAATAAVGLIAIAPAQAQDEPFIVTAPRAADIAVMRVGYRDLNLTYAPARVTLIRRVDHAVKQVCFEHDQRAVRALPAHMEYVDCRTVAWNGARPQLAAAINQSWARAARTGNGAVPYGSMAMITVSSLGF